MPREKALVTLLLFIVGVGVIFLGVDVVAGDQEGISLEDIRENPENYLEVEVNGFTNLGARRKLYAEFTIAEITLRPDPYNRLWETYYLVYINDTFGYELPFVISEDDLPKYQEYVGETVLFKLYFFIGHELLHPVHFLITNILTVKVDASLGLHYYVRIYLAEPISLENVANYPENYLALGNNSIRHNEFHAEFTVVSVSEPVTITDWYGNKWEICIVLIKDSYDYGLPFYILSDNYQNYTIWVGESAPFKISVGDGPYYESWSLGLVINRIAYKPHDNYSAAYSAYIYLARPAKPATFEFSNLLVSPAEVLAGESFSVSVNVTNTGDVKGNHTVTLKINSKVEETKEVTLAVGASETVTFTVTINVAGTYNVDVDGQSGIIEVTADSPFPWRTSWIIGTMAATTLALTVLAFQKLKKKFHN